MSQRHVASQSIGSRLCDGRAKKTRGESPGGKGAKFLEFKKRAETLAHSMLAQENKDAKRQQDHGLQADSLLSVLVMGCRGRGDKQLLGMLVL